MGTTTALRQALKRKFIPFAESRGFVVDRRDQPISTVFRRYTGKVVHIFAVQWEEYGSPRFIINFGTCPACGVVIRGESHSAENYLPSWCDDSGTLQPSRGNSSRSWFRQDHSMMHRLSLKSSLRAPEDVVEEMLALFPELEHYWSTGEVGQHMRIWPSRENKQ